MPRTLIVHTGGIGDFLLALPAIEELAKGTPVELAGYRDRLELAVAGGIAAAAHSLDAIEFHSVFDEPSSRLREFLSRFDRVIVWMRDPDHTIQHGLERCEVPRVDVFPGLPDSDWSRHASEYYAECLRVTPDPEFRLNVSPQHPPLDAVIHPGSGSPSKNWPMPRFAALASSLAAAGRTVTWCIGPAEAERAHTTEPPGATLICESLVDLAQRLITTKLYFGNDSGITHLAAILGVPTVAIFGPTNPAVWAPRGSHAHVVKGNPWPTLEEVASKAT